MKETVLCILLLAGLHPLTAEQQQLTPVQIDTLCLTVQQTYPAIEEDFSLPLEAKVGKFLTHMGTTIRPLGEPCEATLTVRFTGKAKEGGFTTGTGVAMNCVAQADYEIEMDLLLAGAGGRRTSQSTSRFTCRLIQESDCSRDPREAPFDQAWQEGVLTGLARIWPADRVYRAALETDDRRFQFPALQYYLYNKPSPAAVPGLMRLLKSAQAEKRAPAVGVGKTIVNPQSSWELSYILLNGPSAVQNLGPESVAAVPDLCEFLQDSSQSVRAVSAGALGKIGPGAHTAVPCLIAALKDAVARGERSESFEGALKKITGQKFGKRVDRWQEWWEGRRTKQ
jgi:hypothetical protein